MHLRNENHENEKENLVLHNNFGLGYQILRPIVIGIIKHETAY